eukprot:Sdes_comp8888_c0_seq1m282
MQNYIQIFKKATHFCVVGASKDPSKFGNRVLKKYLNLGKNVVCVHPKETKIENVPSFPSVSNLPKAIASISVVVPPSATNSLLKELNQLLKTSPVWSQDSLQTCSNPDGNVFVWLQPGSEDPLFLETSPTVQNQRLKLIYGGPCVLVTSWKT